MKILSESLEYPQGWEPFGRIQKLNLKAMSTMLTTSTMFTRSTASLKVDLTSGLDIVTECYAQLLDGERFSMEPFKIEANFNPDKHLGYAMQWALFCLVLLTGSFLLYRRIF